MDGHTPAHRALTRIAEAPFSPERELAAFMRGRADSGACVSFVGLVRTSGDVTALELQHYPGFTDAEVERLARGAREKHNLDDVLVIHRVGRLAPGEPIVLAAALSAHRADAFKAVEALMDLLKTEAPFWKREWRADGAHWIEPTAEDVRRSRQVLDKS